MPKPRAPQSFLPLAADSAIILVVLSVEPRHGYGIIRDVEERSGGEIVLQTGALYRLLRRLLADALIAEVDAPADAESTDDRRRYYAITDLGRAVLAAEVERMSRLIRAARGAEAGRRPRLV